jgi:hypothetical protein
MYKYNKKFREEYMRYGLTLSTTLVQNTLLFIRWVWTDIIMVEDKTGLKIPLCDRSVLIC